MPEDELDPGATTQMFQAFVDRADETEESASPWTRVAIVGAALVALVLVLALAWFLLGG